MSYVITTETDIHASPFQKQVSPSSVKVPAHFSGTARPGVRVTVFTTLDPFGGAGRC